MRPVGWTVLERVDGWASKRRCSFSIGGISLADCKRKSRQRAVQLATGRCWACEPAMTKGRNRRLKEVAPPNNQLKDA